MLSTKLKRRDFRLDVLLKAGEKPKKKPRQESLFYTQDDTSKYLSQNPVTGEYMAEPICDLPFGFIYGDFIMILGIVYPF